MCIRDSLRADRAVLWRLHGQGRPHRAGEFRQLRLDADIRDAEGGNDRDAVGRLLGRGRRAHHLRRRTRGAQRDLRGDRAALPIGAAARARPQAGVTRTRRAS